MSSFISSSIKWNSNISPANSWGCYRECMKEYIMNAVNITGHFIFPWCNAGCNLVINNSSRYSLIRQTFVKHLLVWRSCVRPCFLLNFILLHYPIQSIWICLALILILSWSGGGRKLAFLDPVSVQGPTFCDLPGSVGGGGQEEHGWEALGWKIHFMLHQLV